MCILSFFRILIYNSYPIVFSIYGIFEIHYKLWNLVYSLILNVLFFIYIKIFRGKIFHHFFFEISCFQSVPAGRAIWARKNTIQNHLLLSPPTFNKMHFGYFKTPLFKTYLHTFKLESFFGNILHFWGNLLIILG